MNNIKVYFILINYNGFEDTVECIKSLLSMRNYKSNMNILVVDNASVTDREQLKVFCNNNHTEFIQMDYNAGFGIANNIAAEYAMRHSADYIILLNNDTVVASNMLEEMEKNFDKRTVLSPVIYYYDYPDEVWCAGGYISRLKGTSVHYKKLGEGKIDFLTGCCISIPASVYRRYGLFDENFFMYYEDTDLSVRYGKNNIAMNIVNEAKLLHKIGKSSNKVVGLKDYYLTRNRLYMVKKHKDVFCVPICFAYFVMTRVILIILCLVKKETPKYYWEGIRDHYKSMYGARKG